MKSCDNAGLCLRCNPVMNRLKLPVSLICFLLTHAVFAAIREPVQLDSGLISGVAGSNTDVCVFKGIPYAAPPVGDLRWRPPMPVVPWRGVRKADSFSAICPQVLPATNSFYGIEYFLGPQPPMSEDCLYLNVWTAAKSSRERRPVMVWIHGGGNVQGYASEPCFDGDAFARKGVVLVSINYRLGIFSCFAHPALTAESPQHVSGNYGEFDQIAALKWVQKNIAAFGGNPTNVTIFGQSSGGASINRLLVSPLAKGLFQKVIIESAAVWNSRDSKATLAEMEQRGVLFAETNGVHTLKELRAMSANDLLAGFAKLRFDPNIDGYVLPDLAVNIFSRGGQFAVPMLLGSTSDEGSFAPVKAATFRADIAKRFGALTNEFFKLYPADSDAQAAQSKHDERRDESAAGERAEAASQAALGQPVWLYYFDRKPPGRDREKYGAFHASELEYVFNTLNATDRPWEETDRKLADAMIAYWSNFAATGNPNGAGLPPWPAYDSKSDMSMELGGNIGARPIPNKTQLDFLKNFLDKDAR
jgi:para-nitrobenzyl esterase